MSSIPGFYRIPQEILNQILDDLEEGTPRVGEDAYLRGQPYLASAQDETQTKQQQQPKHLKSLSLVSKRLRATLLDRLFVRLQLIAHPPSKINTERYSPRDSLFDWIAELSDIAAFVCHSNLGKTVKSFILKIVDGQGHYHIHMAEEIERDSTKESTFIGKHWHQLLNKIPLLERLTIIAPPFCLGVMISVPLDPWISQVLHMPYQVFSLGREVEPLSDSTENSFSSKSSLLDVSKWTSVLLNEGSFIRWYAQGPLDWEDELLSAMKLPEAFCANIKSYEYIGIFPPSHSFQRLMNNLRAMPELRSFSFQVQPTADLLYDTAQRESASFQRLQQAIQLDYLMVADEMVEPVVHMDSEGNVNIFPSLDHIQCLDQESASREMWQRAVDGLGSRRWTRDENDGSLRRK